MACLRISPIRLAVFLLSCALPSIVPAQDPAFSHERAVPPSVEPSPFPATSVRPKSIYTVEIRSADELTPQDKLLLADSESSIAEHAGLVGMEYGAQSRWSYRQIVCPSFPNHLFLNYMQNNGRGDVTMFSVSIPRNGEGRVRIVPILKRGYSLFSPAPINALTISSFNHIRTEEGESANSDWLGNALCYAALVGSVPQVLPPDASPEVNQPIPALSAALDIEKQGKGVEIIRFDDAAGRPHPMEWSMTFTRNGKLIKATHRPAPLLTAQEASQKSAILSTHPIP